VGFSEGDLERSAAQYQRAAEGFAAIDDRMRLGIVRSNQAEVAAMRGDVRRAIEYATDSVAMAREVNDADSLALALHTLGRLVLRAGDAERARQLFRECLVCARELGYHEVLASCVQAAAEVAVADGTDAGLAARLQGVAWQSLDRIGVRPQGLEGESFERVAEALAARLSPERLGAIAGEAADVPLESVLGDALALLERDATPEPRGAPSNGTAAESRTADRRGQGFAT
jgi:tetratricopeptide (TPR) repeat protein